MSGCFSFVIIEAEVTYWKIISENGSVHYLNRITYQPDVNLLQATLRKRANKSSKSSVRLIDFDIECVRTSLCYLYLSLLLAYLPMPCT